MTHTPKVPVDAAGIEPTMNDNAEVSMDKTAMESSGVLIEVKGLRKHYGPIRAVDDIDFQVRRGEVLGFLGPNGAGKTTAMKMITGFLEPDAGTIRIAGFDVERDPIEVKRRIGYLPENAPSYGEMTVKGFLDFILGVRRVENPKEALDRVVERTGLASVFHQTIETLSKGFKRRVGLAQALIHDPEVLILDEPTDGLDPNQKALVQELITGLSSNKAIILSTHVLDEAEKVCSRAIIISKGKILVDSTPEALSAEAPNHNAIRLKFKAGPGPEMVRSIRELPWCGRVNLTGGNRLEILPEDRENHLMELLEVVGESKLDSVQLLEGRLDDLFREVTEGVCA